jgi:hypothetical protein
MNMAVRTLTQDEKDEISVINAEQFGEITPDYYGSPSNSERMTTFIRNQVGDHYPWTLENFQQAFEHLYPQLEKRPPNMADEQFEAGERQAIQAEIPFAAPLSTEELEENAFIEQMKSAGNIPGSSALLTKENLTRLREIERKKRFNKMRFDGDDPARVLERAGEFAGVNQLSAQTIAVLPKP